MFAAAAVIALLMISYVRRNLEAKRHQCRRSPRGDPRAVRIIGSWPDVP
ncbi:hypothetical protein ACIHDR_40415 [Nocardia sp. NPDC052278]